MTTPLETQPQHRAVPLQGGGGVCVLLEPAGLSCGLPAGHPPPCKAAVVTEPPAADPPSAGPGPAAPVASEPEPPRPRKRKYGFNRSPEFDVDLPSGAFVRMRQLSNTQAIDLGLVNMRDAFAPELLQGLRDAQDGDEEAQQRAMDVFVADDTRDKIWGPIDKALVLAVLCPKVVAGEEESTDTQIHVSEISLQDKLVMFEAALPDELKSGAQEGQAAALKSLRT